VIQKLLIPLLCVLTLYGAAPSFSVSHTISTQKDQFALFNLEGKPFYFRWTLFQNRGLVMHFHYDGFPYQAILYDRYRLNGFKIPIKDMIDYASETPFIYVIFTEFDGASKTARFQVHLYDPTGNIKLMRGLE